MRESLYFIFDGKSSKDFGIFLGSTGGGLFQDIFLPTRNIIEKKITGREKPYLQRVEQEPLSFSFSFVLGDWSETDNIDYLRSVTRWLFQDQYKPLIFNSNPNRVFYAIIEGESNLFHNGAKDGYVEVNVRCNSPYSYTPEYIMNNIEFRDSDDLNHVDDDMNTFDDGIHDNTEVLSNGLTIAYIGNTWGDLYSKKKKWGEIK